MDCQDQEGQEKKSLGPTDCQEREGQETKIFGPTALVISFPNPPSPDNMECTGTGPTLRRWSNWKTIKLIFGEALEFDHIQQI